MIIVNILGEFEKERHGRHACRNLDITRAYVRLNNVIHRRCRKMKEPRKRRGN